MTELLQDLLSGHLTLATVLIWTFCALLIAMLGGALMGIRIAGKDLGYELAGLVGAFFGPVGTVPGVLVGLGVLACLR
ncbi:MAG: hypothetical protein KF778_06470 [Rhodocyclaceae bacterium]|nr:hypothetical protein [Rhodocyclaceae bacterium]MBX3668030.1 hypothetical protein [Rhodocyclaceae bacterium]